MDPRTLRKIVRKIMADRLHPMIVTRINGYKYLITYVEDADIVTAEPLGGGRNLIKALKATDPRIVKGSGSYFVSTHYKLDSVAYLHGGEVFKKAVEWCHEVHNEIKKLRKGR